jgi:predicted nucleic acid-binding protein
MIAYVLDASAWLRLFVPDGPLPDGLEDAVRRAEQGDALLSAPDLAWVEVAHALHRKRTTGLLTDQEFAEVWADLRRLPVHPVSMQHDLDTAIELAQAVGLGVCDACYAALAQRLGARLFTADRELAQAADRLGLNPH